MKKWLLGSVLFICSYLLFMVASIPAKSVLTFINLPNNVTLSNVSGTLWHAKITQLNITLAAQKNIVINKVQAHLPLISLLSLAPKIVVDFGERLTDGPRGHLILGNLFGELSIKNSEINIFANEISQQLVLPVPVTALGKLAIKVDHYTVGKPLCTTLKADINWENAALTAFEQTVNLQTIQGKLRCEKGAIVLTINPKNNLGLSFSSHLYNIDRISGQGYLTPGSHFPPALQQLLPFLGKADNKGRYRLQF